MSITIMLVTIFDRIAKHFGGRADDRGTFDRRINQDAGRIFDAAGRGSSDLGTEKLQDMRRLRSRLAP
jgi:hypothetical protein